MMPSWVGAIMWDVVKDVRGSIAMMMFILEEAIQSVGMGMWIAHKEKDWARVVELANLNKTYLISPLLELSRSAWAYAAYPLGLSYEKFAVASMASCKMYWFSAIRGQGLTPTEEMWERI